MMHSGNLALGWIVIKHRTLVFLYSSIVVSCRVRALLVCFFIALLAVLCAMPCV